MLDATIVSKCGVVVLRDKQQKLDVIVLTPTEVSWIAAFLQRYTTSEIVVQLRLAATHAEQQALNPQPDEKEFRPDV